MRQSREVVANDLALHHHTQLLNQTEALSLASSNSCRQLAILQEARQFMKQFYSSTKRLNTPAHKTRLAEIEHEISSLGRYNLKNTELIFGAKLAWRNAPRCIGRIQWSKLQVRVCTNN